MNKKLRAAVLARADGNCEACGFAVVFGHLDHWLSGNGRRRQSESVESCWILCLSCDLDRTANRPNAAHWNARFKAHCEKHGYPVLAHVEHAPVVRR